MSEPLATRKDVEEFFERVSDRMRVAMRWQLIVTGLMALSACLLISILV